MNRILLDTCAYSAFFRGHADVIQAIRAADEILLTPIVLGELHAGFARGVHHLRNERELEAFLTSSRVNVVTIDSETALRYAEIVTFLRRSGMPIPTNDIWIAASAMQLGAALLTTDAHFKKIPQVLVHCYEA